MLVRIAAPMTINSIVDGVGIRAVIWMQGCSHNCKGCHNPETHSFKDGYLVDIIDIKKEIDSLALEDGITLSGGDPMMQVDASLEIAAYAHKKNLNVWCYTGYTFEELMNMSQNNTKIIDLLNEIDVLVDGRFVLDKRSLAVRFRGSTNQRLINVKESLMQGQVIEEV